MSAALEMGRRRVLTALRKRLLDAQGQRDRAARTGNAVAAYSFALLAEELGSIVADAERIYAEEAAIARARLERGAP